MRSLKILYLSVHEPLEYDDLQIFTSRGHRVFSLGSYIDSAKVRSEFRPGKPEFFQADDLSVYEQIGLCDSFLKRFDVIVVTDSVDWIRRRADILKGKFVILRTIGQSSLGTEAIAHELSGQISIVRYSHREVGLPGFAKTDDVIYFGKDLSGVENWSGGETPVTFHNNYQARSTFCSPSVESYESIVLGTKTKIFGAGNQGIANWAGLAPFDEMQGILKTCACYLYTWSTPPSYTLSLIEALIVGAPVVAPSVSYVADVAQVPGKGWLPQRYEVPALLADRRQLLFFSDADARRKLELAASGTPAIRDMAARVRDRARAKFDMTKIAAQWDTFFARNLGL